MVFALMAMLLTLSLPRYLAVTDEAKEKVREQNMATLRDALDKFRADQGRYPTELSELVRLEYLRTMPSDPVTGSTGWTLLAHPSAAEKGVYDVSAPSPAGSSKGESTSGLVDPRQPETRYP